MKLRYISCLISLKPIIKNIIFNRLAHLGRILDTTDYFLTPLIFINSMKKVLFVWISLLMAFNCSAGTGHRIAVQTLEQDTLIVGVKTDIPLFGYKDPKTGEITGFDIDIAKALIRYLLGDEKKLVLKAVTPSTRLPAVQKKEVDLVIATTTITDERKQLVDFSDSYFEVGQSMLVMPQSKITSVNELANQNILVVKNTVALTIMPKKMPSAKLLEYENYVEAVKALRAGQGVALVSSSFILVGLQKENPDLRVVGGLFSFESFGVAIHKGDNIMRLAVNTALRKMRASGEYQEIYQKWFGEIVEEEYDKFYQKNFGALLKQ